MTALAKTRDSETGNHICRTQHYVLALSMALQTHPRFSHFLTNRNIEILFKSAPLHDIGKVGIPDRILLKPGSFDASEMEIMKTHTTLGRDAIQYAERLLEHGLDFLTIAKQIAYSHHEKWDGSGYPQGLVGDEIPIPALLMAVADVYDTIISRRVYKPGMPHLRAVDIIMTKGHHFDPDIVDAFLSILDEFKAISRQFPDADGAMQEQVDSAALSMEAVDD
ncbi:HD domain-containing phosphohydrolase [Rhodoferax sp. PAMC 29310]|uniref:HD-GYP domain-containing protein n=1 Tax=Rhodoferax sp. PAMC 29310 TaxID=2822760 RepID=UPI001B337959